MSPQKLIYRLSLLAFIIILSCSEPDTYIELDLSKQYVEKLKYYEAPSVFTQHGRINNPNIIEELIEDSIYWHNIKTNLSFDMYEATYHDVVPSKQSELSFLGDTAIHKNKNSIGSNRHYSFYREQNNLFFTALKETGWGISFNSLYYLMAEPRQQVDTVKKTTFDQFRGAIKDDGIWVPNANYFLWGGTNKHFTYGKIYGQSVIADPSIYIAEGDSLIVQRYWSIYQ